MYILKRCYKEIGKSIFYNRMMVKKHMKIKKALTLAPYLANVLKTNVIFLYLDYHCHIPQKYFRLTQ